MNPTPGNEGAEVPETPRTVSIETQPWQAPLPLPEHLEQYERTVPGAGERILKMAGDEQRHRHSQESVLLELDATEQRQTFTLRLLGSGMWLILLLVGVLLALLGQEVNGYTVIGGTGLVWALVTLLRMLRGSNGSSGGNS